MQARQMGGDTVGATGTSTATSSSSLTDSGATFIASGYIGHVVVAAGVFGVITANTGTALTVDRWYTPGSPGGAAGSTPGATSVYVVLPGGAPAWYIALTANATAPSASDTTLTAEITTASGGLIRKVCPYAHTTGAASYTLTPVFTANGSDSLPVTIAKIGVFNSLTSGQMLFETLLSATATLSAVGDAITVTETVTL